MLLVKKFLWIILWLPDTILPLEVKNSHLEYPFSPPNDLNIFDQYEPIFIYTACNKKLIMSAVFKPKQGLMSFKKLCKYRLSICFTADMGYCRNEFNAIAQLNLI